MSLLAAAPELSFTEMRDTLKMTDGNLSMHIKTLQEAGFVSVTKSYQPSAPPDHLRPHAGGAEGLRRPTLICWKKLSGRPAPKNNFAKD